MTPSTTKSRYQQPFAIGQEKPFVQGPFLGGYIALLPVNVGAGGTITFGNPLRCKPRHVEIVGTIAGEYPSRMCFTSATTAASVTVKFESAQSAGAAIWIW